MKFIKSLCLLLMLATAAYAQGPVLSGTVKDVKGVPVQGAGVYLSGYKNATVSDADGKFKFTGLNAGNYDILIQSLGFLPGKASTVLSGSDVNLNIVLEENVTDIKAVVVMPDAKRQGYIRLFKDFFIGKTENSATCRIINPQVLNIDYEDGILKVNTDEFLIIENQALGYRIKYLLQQFEYNYKTRIVYYEGYPTFEDLEGSKSKLRKWEKAREKAYYGSLQHFYRTLREGTTAAEGFIINKITKQNNANRKPDSLIEANIKKYTSGRNAAVNILTMKEGDSLSYWLSERRKPKTINFLNRAVIPTDTLVHTYDEDIKYINYTGDLFVIYTKERETGDYEYSGYRLNRAPDIPNYQVSQIEMLKRPVAFYKNGSLADPTSTLYSGYWAYEKIGDQVPIDYEPPVK